jgi:hypothetical protein
VRLRSFVIAAALAWPASLVSPSLAVAEAPPPRAAKPADLSRARALDQQGAKAYADGRYNDAIRYFEEAYRLGGPPFELWNIAKCHLRLDQPEEAAATLERYLAVPDLPPEDREEATQQLEALKQRPSTLTVASSPAGASVTVDGQPQPGQTPLSVKVPPGKHTVEVAKDGRATHTEDIEARYGRAVIVNAELREGEESAPAVEDGADRPRPLALRAWVGVMLPRHGEVGGRAAPGLLVAGTYHVMDVGGGALGVGGAVHVTGDSWNNTIGSNNQANPCGVLRQPHSATALSAFALGALGWPITPRWRASALAGLGVASYLAGDLGGDLFVPTCDASPGLQPAALFGAQIDYAITSAVRLSAVPIAFQLQRAFAGSRSAPLDVNGLWTRATIAIGIGVDL